MKRIPKKVVLAEVERYKRKTDDRIRVTDKKVRYEQIEKAIDCRTPMGVPEPLLLDVFKELGYGKRELNRFHKWMYGQTCGLVGNIPIYYKCDLYRFISHDCDMNTYTLD